METEFEIRILDIDVGKIKKKLESLGAKFLMSRKQRRNIYFFKPKEHATWLRLRDQGDKSTLTIKKLDSYTIDGAKELEVEVSDFEKTDQILRKLGFESALYQENKRESYSLNGADVEIDSWPKIPPYLEIEGSSIEEIEAIVKLLGFDMSQTTPLHGDAIYEHYGLNINDFKELKF
ncbi:class IV adenylate cyclase [archaeon]|nr:class IV adenylate cyclase [archaeon]MBL7057487.1 class IV adenylate cyclase [Candidatus Woesearchaeota archaeon]